MFSAALYGLLANSYLMKSLDDMSPRPARRAKRAFRLCAERLRTSKYMPHQGERETARRRRQIAKGQIRVAA